MSGIRIDEPCGENFDAMPKTELGGYCDRCRFEVIDFTRMSTREIRDLLKRQANQKLCGHIEKDQLIALNQEYDNWKQQRLSLRQSMLMALLVVFGISLFSCSNQEDRRTVLKWRKNAIEWVAGTESPVVWKTDSTLTGEITCATDEVKTIEHQNIVDGGIGMDPEFFEYLHEE